MRKQKEKKEKVFRGNVVIVRLRIRIYRGEMKKKNKKRRGTEGQVRKGKKIMKKLLPRRSEMVICHCGKRWWTDATKYGEQNEKKRKVF